MRKRSLKKELYYLWTRELLCIFMFWASYLVLMDNWSISITYSLSLLSIVLIQGSIYWFNCSLRCNKKKALSLNVVAPLYKFFKFFNYALFVVFIPILILAKETSGIKLASILIFGFVCLEQINYFHIRLSYFSESQILKPMLNIFTGKAPKSQIAKDIEKFEKRTISEK